jgi:hypothetical protein
MNRCNLIVLLALFAVGCGDSKSLPPDFGGEDGLSVVRCIEDVSEATTNQKKLNEMFATGASPLDVKKISGAMFSVVGKPTINGTTATAKVRIEKGQLTKEQDWTFEKVGDKWKIKTAPL